MNSEEIIKKIKKELIRLNTELDDTGLEVGEEAAYISGFCSALEAVEKFLNKIEDEHNN